MSCVRFQNAENVIKSLPHAVIMADSMRAFLWANDQALKMFPELSGLEPGSPLIKVVKCCSELFDAGDHYIHEINGGHYECRIVKMEQESGTDGYCLSFSDVTCLYSHIEELKTCRDRVESPDRAKHAYIAGACHELRTPLNVIIGMSEMVLRSEITEKWRSSIEDIHRSGQELLETVNAMLDLSKIEENRFEMNLAKYSLGEILGDIYKLCAIHLAERPIEFEILINHELPQTFIGDRRYIKTILTNLTSNALKYTSEGAIRIIIDMEQDTGDTCILSFAIQDTGIGVREEDIDLIFESYMRADTGHSRSIQGTGLGLAITKHLVNLMNGTISVASRYGEGSEFCVRIPQGYAGNTGIGKGIYNPLSMQDTGSKKNEKPCRGGRVLVVDDMKVNLIVASELIKRLGMEADTASCGREAVELAANRHYDIIFMDSLMPGMDGAETAREIRSLDGGRLKNLPIVVMTADSYDNECDDYKDVYDGFIPKPVDITRLEQMISGLRGQL